MKPIPGGVDKVTHPNAKVNGGSPLKGPMNDYCNDDLSGDATNSIKSTSPFGRDKVDGLSGHRSATRNR